MTQSSSRGEAARERISRSYCGIDELTDSQLDGLIVTRTEPRASSLPDEPYWDPLMRVLAWSAVNTTSTIWSWLAAHAAVLHLDGIDRVALVEKQSVHATALAERGEAMLARFPLAFLATRLKPLSRSAAARIYRNWLSLLRPQHAVPVAPRLRRTGTRASAQDAV